MILTRCWSCLRPLNAEAYYTVVPGPDGEERRTHLGCAVAANEAVKGFVYRPPRAFIPEVVG